MIPRAGAGLTRTLDGVAQRLGRLGGTGTKTAGTQA